MSKLYVKANTDAVKTPKTARGHREVTADLSYNWGGNTPAGTFEVTMLHRGESVLFRVDHGTVALLNIAVYEDGEIVTNTHEGRLDSRPVRPRK
jgi:hypothetical protein